MTPKLKHYLLLGFFFFFFIVKSFRFGSCLVPLRQYFSSFYGLFFHKFSLFIPPPPYQVKRAEMRADAADERADATLAEAQRSRELAEMAKSVATDLRYPGLVPPSYTYIIYIYICSVPLNYNPPPPTLGTSKYLHIPGTSPPRLHINLRFL